MLQELDRLVGNKRPYVLLGLVLALITVQLFRTWWRLRHIPGPFLAKFTNLQRVWWVKTKRADLIHKRLHEQYGEVVRMGPNMVSFSNPAAVPVVYPFGPGMQKSDLYATLRAYTRAGGAVGSIFHLQDERAHKELKSPIAPLYSVTSVTSFEGLVDDVIKCLAENFDGRFVQNQQVFDIGSWLQYFAFDVMGTMTFSKRYGFLDQGKDVDGMLDTIYQFFVNIATTTQITWLDPYINKNKYVDLIRRTPGQSIFRVIGQAIQERREKVATGEFKSADVLEGKQDFLARFFDIQNDNPGIPERALTSWTFSNVVAGSDSVGTVMRTTLLHLLRYPDTLHKLYAELSSAELSTPYPKYSEVQHLPYLEACVQEGLRMHPPFALPLERIVPPGGVEVLGHKLPDGTIVGASACVTNFHKPTFGEDAEDWRPERWLESDEAYRHMEQSMLTFGHGRRICLGKHIGIFEIKKLIPFLVLNYDMRIVNPEAFTLENAWFFYQKGFFARIQKRN